MEIIRVDKDKFYEIYLPLCKPVPDLSEAQELEYRDAIDRLDDRLRAAITPFLSEVDFDLNDDWNPCWHHSMGIYGEAAHTKRFLEVVWGVLATEDQPWCFHISCEPDFLNPLWGQLFIHGGKIYADSTDELDYALFERNGSEHAGDGKPDPVSS
jgi:hypothetical protein